MISYIAGGEHTDRTSALQAASSGITIAEVRDNLQRERFWETGFNGMGRLCNAVGGASVLASRPETLTTRLARTLTPPPTKR
jgi:hypothetical protein